jgi:predicted SAM-dependent methyltransferase
MTPIKRLVKASNGDTNLFIYREGDEYFRQKSPVFLREFTAVIFDLSPRPPGSPLIYHDVATAKLPFADNTFDAIDCYHVYEHLNYKEAEFFTAEISRVLKNGGVYRVSVPDMEMIAGEYLKYLNASLSQPSEQNLKRYNWCVMKLIEQSIRETPGGLMLEAMRAGRFDREYVKETFGESYAVFFDAPKPASDQTSAPCRNLVQRVRSLSLAKIKNRFMWWEYRKKDRAFRSGPAKDMRKTRTTVTLLPDKVYLRSLLEHAGFGSFIIKDYNTSDIRDWDKYDLDRSNNGDYPFDVSLFVEARKKGAS